MRDVIRKGIAPALEEQRKRKPTLSYTYCFAYLSHKQPNIV